MILRLVMDTIFSSLVNPDRSYHFWLQNSECLEAMGGGPAVGIAFTDDLMVGFS